MTERVKSPQRRSIEQFFVRGIAQLFGFLVRILSLRTLQRIGNAGGLLVMATTPWRQKLADRNMQAVFGDKYDARERRRMRRLVSQGICKTMLELLKVPYLTPDQIRQLVQVEGMQYLREAVANGKGGIVLTAHFGNWELANPLFLIEGLPLSMVARDAPSDSVATLINRARERHGGKVVDRDDVRGMLAALRQGRLLAILPDQHAKPGGILGAFLGLPALVAPGPALFAARTGCPVIPMFVFRQPDDTFICRISPQLALQKTGDREADVAANTQIIMDAIGERIREVPEQWLWLHDRWRPHDAA